MTTLILSHPSDTLVASTKVRAHWWRRPGAIVSLLLHGGAVAALIALSQGDDKPQTISPPAIQLVLAPPEPPKQLIAPPPSPAPPQPPKAVQPPRPVPPRQAPRVAKARTTPTTAEKAQVTAPPEPAAPLPPTQSAPAAPGAPAAPPSPAAPPRPRNIGMEGIPSDYVAQVYARIDKSAAGHYPRIAKMQQLQGRIVYRLTLAPDGTLLKYEIRTSGESILDEAAVETIKAAAPYPKLPDLGGATYQLSGAIVYRYDD